MAVDPVCGMTVDPARAAGNFDHGGTTYYFCSKGCLAKFAADPEKYLSGAQEPMAPAAPAVLTIGGLKKPHARAHEAPASAASVSESPLPRDRREHEASASAAPVSESPLRRNRREHEGPEHEGPEHEAPEHVAREHPAPSTQHPSPVEYVCPMDPEVLSDKPGACPKCGMALEPRVATLTDEPNPELVDMTRRFWIGVLLGAPVFILTIRSGRAPR